MNETKPLYCLNCAKELKGMQKKFCCPKCKHDYYQKQKQEIRRIYDKVCPICGKQFRTATVRRIYCCQECADIAAHAQINARPKETKKPTAEREPETKTKPSISVDTAAKLQRVTGQSYGQMFAPKVTVEIPDWARGE